MFIIDDGSLLAQQRSKNPQVMAFAAMMVKDPQFCQPAITPPE
jgi:predicted outer membrane protein